MSHDERTYYDVDGAAGYLNLSKHTLTRWRTEGGGPMFAKIGGRVLYRRVDLDAWVAARVRRNTCDEPAAAAR